MIPPEGEAYITFLVTAAGSEIQLVAADGRVLFGRSADGWHAPSDDKRKFEVMVADVAKSMASGEKATFIVHGAQKGDLNATPGAGKAN